jgi:predicted CoA-binding protein
MNEIDGDKCYSSISSLPEELDSLIISVAPDKTISVVEEAKNAGMKKIWIQRGSQSLEAVKFCRENDVDVISGECILMFADPAMFIHRAHRWINKVTGKLPV